MDTGVIMLKLPVQQLPIKANSLTAIGCNSSMIQSPSYKFCPCDLFLLSVSIVVFDCYKVPPTNTLKSNCFKTQANI